MKTHITLLAAALCFTLTSADAQPGPGRPGGMGGMRGMAGMGGPQGTQISAAMAKLFGENRTFTADLESDIQMAPDRTMKVPGKIAYDSGKARFELNMADATGDAIPPQATAQMKTMGMDKVITISRPEENVNYMIYPGLKAYTEMQGDASAGGDTNITMETTSLGEETVAGHSTEKKKAVVTDEQGRKHEFTIWNATDLKDFPVKVETTEQGTQVTMMFKNVKFAKPNAGLFNPPSDYKKYDNMMDMMREEMMKRMGQGQGPGGMPPGQQ